MRIQTVITEDDLAEHHAAVAGGASPVALAFLSGSLYLVVLLVLVAGGDLLVSLWQTGGVRFGGVFGGFVIGASVLVAMLAGAHHGWRTAGALFRMARGLPIDAAAWKAGLDYGPTLVEYGPERLTMSRDLVDATIDWAAVEAVRETDRSVVVMVAPQAPVIIPKRDVPRDKLVGLKEQMMAWVARAKENAENRLATPADPEATSFEAPVEAKHMRELIDRVVWERDRRVYGAAHVLGRPGVNAVVALALIATAYILVSGYFDDTMRLDGVVMAVGGAGIGVVLASAIAMIVNFFGWLRWRVSPEDRRAPSLRPGVTIGPQRLTMGATGVMRETPLVVEHFAWRGLDEIVEGDDAAFIMMSPTRGLIAPWCGFGDAAMREQRLNEISERMGSDERAAPSAAGEAEVEPLAVGARRAA